MKRRVFNILAAAFLGLALVFGALWVRSLWWTIDGFAWVYGVDRTITLASDSGSIHFFWSNHWQPTYDYPPPIFRLYHLEARWATQQWVPRWEHDTWQSADTKRVGSSFDLILPDWLLIPLLLILPVAWMARSLRVRRKRIAAALNACPSCGYDLRASKDKCPECGAAIPGKSAA